MQELRIVALDDDGTALICEGPAGRFRLPVDDTLRAAAAGELTRGVQTELEFGTELSPRDIQARIRAGATIDEVAALAGAPVHRIKRFASPVLLERARAAELAQLSHPVRGDGPMHTPLAEVLAVALAERGHTDTPRWDAWKGPDQRWIVQICWTVGKSSNEAHFKFAPGSQGGTSTPIDDTARALLDPDARGGLRSINRGGAEPHADSSATADSPADPAGAPLRAVASGEPPAPAPMAKKEHTRRHPEMPSWEDVLLGVRGSN